MAFTLSAGSHPVAEMNITPLVDVMLVLLIIFMVTMPLRTIALTVDLPQAVPNAPPPPHPINLRIDRAGQLTWNGSAMPMAVLEGALAVEAARHADPKDQPQVLIDTDPDAEYGRLATVLSAARNAGMDRVGFVADGRSR